MYLLLVENSFISSREIKSLLDKNSIKCEVVNCSSSEALLDIAEKLAPDIVIIDFDFYIDDSAEIVRELRRHNDKAYIFAFIDPDHYEKIYRAIEEGIDDYLVKPLQREDVTLRIKMGLQRKTSQVKKPAATAVRDQVDSTKLFKDIADAFGQEYREVEKTFFTSENAESKTGQPAEGDYSDLEYISEINELASQDMPAEEDILSDEFAREEVPEKPDGDKYIDDLFAIEPEPDLAADAEEELEKEYEDLSKIQADPDSFIIDYLSDDDILIDKEEPTEAESTVERREELAQFIFEQVDTGESKPEDITDDLQYLDQLFGVTDGKEETDITAVSEEQAPVEKSSAESEESRVAFQEESPGKLDDAELFGANKEVKNVDTKTFEALFGSTNDQIRKKRRLSAGLKTDKNKPGTVEYLFSAKKPDETEKEMIADDPLNENLCDEDKFAESTEKSRGQDHKAKGSSVTRIFNNILKALLIVIMVSMSFYLIQSRIGGGTPTIAGYKAYVVLSGSMSPAFDTGSLVFVKQAEPLSITEGDIITYSNASDPERLTTHRVVGINREDGLNFLTRGDANNVNDPNPVAAENLVGVVTGSVPYIGYLLGYAQTSQGLVLLIFIPGFLILLLELRMLLSYLAESKAQKSAAVSKTAVRPVGEEHQVKAGVAAGDFDFLNKSYQN